MFTDPQKVIFICVIELLHLLDLNSPRCNKCLTKLWCSKECLKQDWEIAHKDTCTEQPDKRKVKAGKKKRTVAGVKMQKNQPTWLSPMAVPTLSPSSTRWRLLAMRTTRRRRGTRTPRMPLGGQGAVTWPRRIDNISRHFLLYTLLCKKNFQPIKILKLH